MRPLGELKSDERIANLLSEAVVRPRVATAASAGTLDREGHVLSGFAGQARPDSIFDLASLTKPCTALLTVALAEQGCLRLSARLADFLPELRNTPGGEATLEQHLSHRANMLAHVELFRPALAGHPVHRRALLLRVARAGRSRQPSGAETDAEPGVSPALYSDLGYILVGAALEAVSHMPLDDLLRQVVTGPLGLELDSARGFLRSGHDFATRVLPTEDIPARGGTVRGVVHDDNAWALGGTALMGHAGLFGTLRGVLQLSGMLLSATRADDPWARRCEPLLRRRPGGTLRMGVDGVSLERSVAGEAAEAGTFGHLGFTGTSFWCDPERGLASVLLTNRTFPSRRQAAAIRAARPVVHDALRGFSDRSREPSLPVGGSDR